MPREKIVPHQEAFDKLIEIGRANGFSRVEILEQVLAAVASCFVPTSEMEAAEISGKFVDVAAGTLGVLIATHVAEGKEDGKDHTVCAERMLKATIDDFKEELNRFLDFASATSYAEGHPFAFDNPFKEPDINAQTRNEILEMIRNGQE